MDIESVFALIFMTLMLGAYTAGMWYLNSKVTVNEEGFYKSTNEDDADGRDGLPGTVSTAGLIGLASLLILMLVLLVIVLFDPEFLA